MKYAIVLTLLLLGLAECTKLMGTGSMLASHRWSPPEKIPTCHRAGAVKCHACFSNGCRNVTISRIKRIRQNTWYYGHIGKKTIRQKWFYRGSDNKYYIERCIYLGGRSPYKCHLKEIDYYNDIRQGLLNGYFLYLN